MDTIKIIRLLDRYYSGEISPEEYETLISFFKKTKDLTPELEAERRMLIAIETCEAVMPYNFEERLHHAIDRKLNRRRVLKKITLFSSAAAVLVICLTIGVRFSRQVTLQPESVTENVDNFQLSYIAQNSDPEKTTATPLIEVMPQTMSPAKTKETYPTGNAPQTTVAHERKKRVTHKEKLSYSDELTDEDVEEAGKIDAALIEALSGLRGKQNMVLESIENIKINRITL